MKYLVVLIFVGVALAAPSPAGPAAVVPTPVPGAAPAAPPAAQTAVLRCTVDVQVSSSTNPGIGNEGWWARNYGIMEAFFTTCSTPETSNTISLSATKQEFSLPKDHQLRFDLASGGPDKVPFVFLPFYFQDIQNLPGTNARFPAILTCHKLWMEQRINLKACQLVSQ